MVPQWLWPPIISKAPKGRTLHLIPAIFLDHLLAITILFVMAEEEGTIIHTKITSLDM